MAGKTEWEDMLIKLGHMDAPPQEEKANLHVLDLPEKDELTEQLENATLDELDEFEDDEDDKILEEYRKKRLEEMKAAAMKNVFGVVRNISEPEWKAEVTNAPADIFVVVNLFKQGILHSRLLDKHLETLAPKFKATKFIRIKANDAIHNYPDRNIPTILIYNKGDVVGQVVTLAALGGDDTTAEDVEWFLAVHGAVQTELEENPRIKRDSRNKVNFNDKNSHGGFVGKEFKRDSDSDDDSEDDD